MLKQLRQNHWFPPLPLLVWIVLGLGLRLVRLTAQPPWTDECATLTFSLGNSFLGVPLDRPISADTLLQPLHVNPAAGVADVVGHLMSESTHPPIYFALAHGWMRLFPSDGGLVNLWAARSLPALLGVAAIPLTYTFAWLAFRSRRIAQVAAALMAVSPFGVFLAREARHYTLAIVLLLVSLSCWIVAVRAWQQRSPLSIPTALTWVATNAIGMAVHYFFSLAIASQALVFWILWLGDLRRGATSKQPTLSIWRAPWRRIYAVGLGTAVAGLAWFPVLLDIHNSRLTQWVADGDVRDFSPLLRIVAWVVSMLSMLPVDIRALPLWGVVLSGTAMLAFAIWGGIAVYRGTRIWLQREDLAFRAIGGYILGTGLVFASFTYGLANDLTLASRFSFVYFPVFLVFVAASLTRVFGQRALAATIAVGLLGGATIAWDLGYLQHHRSERLAGYIEQTSDVPMLLATTHKHHGQTGRMMGLAWEFRQSKTIPPHQFLLAHKPPPGEIPANDPALLLKQTVEAIPKPLDVWAIDFHAPLIIDEGGECVKDEGDRPDFNGYRYRLYRCGDR